MKVSDLINTFNEKKYFINLDVPWYLNIYGIRGYSKGKWVENKYGEWNDTLGVVFIDENEEIHNFTFIGTTDPDPYYIQNPMSINGTAHLVPGQYLNAYKIDLHSGRRVALCQRLAPVSVFRSKNPIYSYGITTYPNIDTGHHIHTGYFGINIHDTIEDNQDLYRVGAGCQIFYDKEDFQIFISLCYKHRDLYGNKFNYTLFSKEDFIPKAK